MKKKEICKIIDKLVDNAIRKYGLEDEKTVTIAQNAENIKEKYLVRCDTFGNDKPDIGR